MRALAPFLLVLLSCANASQTEHRWTLQPMGIPLGNEPLTLIQHDSAPLPGGTFIAEDKSKGVTWMLDLARRRVRAVELPYNNGNHETAVSADGSVLASPHYETLGPGDDEGGGFYPGAEVSLVDVRTGRSSVLAAVANPLGRPKPHGAHWMDNGDLLVSAQLANSLIRFTTPLLPGGGAARVYSFEGSTCVTPHLVAQIPGTLLAVSACRCDTPKGVERCPGHLAVVDLESGAHRVLDAGVGAEGLTVTPNGEVWVGAQDAGKVSIYGFSGPERRLDQLGWTADLVVPRPLRLAYEPRTNVVGVACNDPDPEGARENFYAFDADTHALRGKIELESQERGRINSEGLAAAAGVFIAGGFDNQTLVLVDPLGLTIRAEVLLPRCSLPAGHDSPDSMTREEASKGAEQPTGLNNLSGGVCPGTLRNPDDRRFAVLDGFSWSPLEMEPKVP